MGKSRPVKQVLGTDALGQNSPTGIRACTGQDTKLHLVNKKALLPTNPEQSSKMNPTAEFRYSGRCYCGYIE